MAARNSADSFGWVTRVIHWLMALGLLGALGFGAYLSRIEPSFSNLWMYGAHKSFGIVLLLLVLVRILWHRISQNLCYAEVTTKPAALVGPVVHGKEMNDPTQLPRKYPWRLICHITQKPIWPLRPAVRRAMSSMAIKLGLGGIDAPTEQKRIKLRAIAFHNQTFFFI